MVVSKKIAFVYLMSPTNCVRLQPPPPNHPIAPSLCSFPNLHTHTHTHTQAVSQSYTHKHKQHAELRCAAAAQYTITTNNFHQFCFHMLLYYRLLVYVAISLCNLSLLLFRVKFGNCVSAARNLKLQNFYVYSNSFLIASPTQRVCVCVSL